MKIYSILIIILLYISCSRPKSELEQLLTNPVKKWVYIEDETLKHPYEAIAYTKFNAKTCENRSLETNNIFLVSIEGNNQPGKWKYDSYRNTLNLYDKYLFTSTKFSSDTIYILNQKTKQKAYFINYEGRK
jgi:hypothetical protein